MNEGHVIMSTERVLFRAGIMTCRRVDRKGRGAVGEKASLTE